MTATRRLAVILAADVAGYSRLMGADEEGTHERLRAHLAEVVDPKTRERHGRIVKTTGDGVPRGEGHPPPAANCGYSVRVAQRLPATLAAIRPATRHNAIGTRLQRQHQRALYERKRASNGGFRWLSRAGNGRFGPRAIETSPVRDTVRKLYWHSD
jgi:class 3 adenylate cyclase